MLNILGIPQTQEIFIYLTIKQRFSKMALFFDFFKLNASINWKKIFGDFV